jgi:hypothetical protein
MRMQSGVCSSRRSRKFVAVVATKSVTQWPIMQEMHKAIKNYHEEVTDGKSRLTC